MAILLSFTFWVLSGIHFNWTFGGTWGLNKALPTNSSGKRLLNPRKIDSFIVGSILTGFGFFYLDIAQYISLKLPQGITKYMIWIIPTIFLLRVIGDFKYVGLFKTVKNTDFAKADTRIFIILCLAISLIGFVIAFKMIN